MSVDYDRFRAWIEESVDRPDVDSPAELARRWGVDEAQLRRWRLGEEEPSRRRIEDVLEHLDLMWWQVFGAEDVELEADGFCARCHEVVTPINDRCPWCDGELDRNHRVRHYCAREDRMVFPANDGSCWRCGSATTTNVPYDPCGCGCGTMIHRFDRFGRRVEYVRGHAPKSVGKHRVVPAGPFRDHLRRELGSMDLIAALARAHGINRDDVVAVLGGAEEVSTEVVRRALWTNARGGTGKGLPPRPGAPIFAELYPDLVRSKVCPGWDGTPCGGGKAPHAELCKRCSNFKRRRARNPSGKGGRRGEQVRIGEHVLLEAKRLRDVEGLPMREVGERLIGQTPYKTVPSFVHLLRLRFKKRGWYTGRLERKQPTERIAA